MTVNHNIVSGTSISIQQKKIVVKIVMNTEKKKLMRGLFIMVEFSGACFCTASYVAIIRSSSLLESLLTANLSSLGSRW